MEVKSVYLHLPIKMVGKLDKRAEELGVPRASIIKQLLHEGLNNGK